MKVPRSRDNLNEETLPFMCKIIAFHGHFKICGCTFYTSDTATRALLQYTLKIHFLFHLTFCKF